MENSFFFNEFKALLYICQFESLLFFDDRQDIELELLYRPKVIKNLKKSAEALWAGSMHDQCFL